MTEPEQIKTTAIIKVLQAQRDQALNAVAVMAGELEEARTELTALRARLAQKDEGHEPH